MTIESNLVLDILSLNLPWVSMVEPVIWNFDLISIPDDLLENTVLIPDTVAPGWDLQGGERVNEACSKSSETSITKGGIALLLVKFLKIVAQIHESISEIGLQVGVDKSILESPSHQKLEGKVVDSFAVIILVILLGIVPRFDQSISNRESGCLVSSEVVEIESSSSEGVLHMVDNLSLDGLGVVAEVGLHQLPHLLRSFLGVVVFEFGLKKLDSKAKYLLCKEPRFLGLANRI
jgi:hypothetical protein